MGNNLLASLFNKNKILGALKTTEAQEKYIDDFVTNKIQCDPMHAQYSSPEQIRSSTRFFQLKNEYREKIDQRKRCLETIYSEIS